MAVSEARKKANAKWDAANMATLAVRVKKEMADQFRAYCAVKGVTVNTELREYVQSCIGGAPEQYTPIGGGGYDHSCTDGKTTEADGAGQNKPVITPAALCAAQNAAKLADEELPVFIERAITSEAKRDEVRRRLRG